MTLPRAVGMILVVTVMAMLVVWQRSHRAQIAHQIHLLARQETKLVREIDEAKAAIARLRAPHCVQERVSKMQLSVCPPDARPDIRAGDRLAGVNRLPSKRW